MKITIEKYLILLKIVYFLVPMLTFTHVTMIMVSLSIFQNHVNIHIRMFYYEYSHHVIDNAMTKIYFQINKYNDSQHLNAWELPKYNDNQH